MTNFHSMTAATAAAYLFTLATPVAAAAWCRFHQSPRHQAGRVSTGRQGSLRPQVRNPLMKKLIVTGCMALGTLFVVPVVWAGWELDPTHTHVSFDVSHLGLTQTPGIFRQVSGQVNYDDKNIEASSVSIAIDTASIDTAYAKRDADLRGADWFDAERHPKITFVSKGVRKVGEHKYVIAGDLSIKGKTLPVDFMTTLTNRTINPFVKLPMVGFYGEARVKRSAFGLAQYPNLIGEDVNLRIALELIQKP